MLSPCYLLLGCSRIVFVCDLNSIRFLEPAWRAASPWRLLRCPLICVNRIAWRTAMMVSPPPNTGYSRHTHLTWTAMETPKQVRKQERRNIVIFNEPFYLMVHTQWKSYDNTVGNTDEMLKAGLHLPHGSTDRSRPTPHTPTHPPTQCLTHKAVRPHCPLPTRCCVGCRCGLGSLDLRDKSHPGKCNKLCSGMQLFQEDEGCGGVGYMSVYNISVPETEYHPPQEIPVDDGVLNLVGCYEESANVGSGKALKKITTGATLWMNNEVGIDLSHTCAIHFNQVNSPCYTKFVLYIFRTGVE